MLGVSPEVSLQFLGCSLKQLMLHVSLRRRMRRRRVREWLPGEGERMFLPWWLLLGGGVGVVVCRRCWKLGWDEINLDPRCRSAENSGCR